MRCVLERKKASTSSSRLAQISGPADLRRGHRPRPLEAERLIEGHLSIARPALPSGVRARSTAWVNFLPHLAAKG